MKITVFYRSLERSNAIVSSTRDELERRHKYGDLNYLDIDFINLDKFGAISTKGITLEKRPGNSGCRI